MRLLIFIFIEIWLLPWQILAIIAYLTLVKRRTTPANISGTANEVIFARLMLHRAGTRQDEAAARLTPHLPAVGPVIAAIYGTFGLASRWSGYMTSWTAFPAMRPSKVNAMVAHRTEFFDRVLADAMDPQGDRPARQVVILGAGWDTRAWGLLADTDARIFEVDTRPTQQAKRAALDAAGLSAERVTFVEADLVDKSWLQAVAEKGFDPELPTFFLWEGVTMYLPAKAVNATLRQVAGLAAGSRIAFDFLSHEAVHAEPPFERLGRTMQTGAKIYANEPFVYGISTKPPARGRIERFITSRGLELVDYEPYGSEDKAFGGLALAIQRHQRST